MVLLFSKVQRCNTPMGMFSYGEEFECEEKLAAQYVAAGVCGKVVKLQPEKILEPKPELMENEPDEIPEPKPATVIYKEKSEKKRGR
jgi:hypothetical protein